MGPNKAVRQHRARLAEQEAHEKETESRDISNWSKDELVAEAARRGITVVRSDGEEGEPVKADYIEALS